MSRKTSGQEWRAACCVALLGVLACVALLGMSNSGSKARRAILQEVVTRNAHGGIIKQRQLRFRENSDVRHLRAAGVYQRPFQLAQLGTPAAAAEAASALRREVENRGGAHSAGMGVLRHIMRDLSQKKAASQDVDCDCSQQQQQQLALTGQSLGSRCNCPPPRLINGEDCDEIVPTAGETSGVRWLIDCPSKWVPARQVAPPPPVQPEEEETYTVGPDVGQTYADAMEAPPGEEEPEIEKDVMGPHPDIFAPQEPWHELKRYRNEWHYDYEAAPYTAQYDDSSEHDQFTPDEPWNNRPDDIVLDATFADLKNACLGAGEDHMWDSEKHQCLYQGEASYAEMPRGRGVTQEGPGRKAMDGQVPLGDVIDDAKELDEFGVRRPGPPPGEVDQFGWRPAPPAPLRDTSLDYQTADLEKACRVQMQIPGKGKAYSWDPAQGKCLYLGRAVHYDEEPPKTTHPLTDSIYADLKSECVKRGGAWRYPRVDGQPGICDNAKRRRR